MVPNKDIYADKDGKITDDPEKYAIQVAAAGVALDERIAKRYGIEDSLVSVDEPGAVRQVRSASVHIDKIEETESEPTDDPDAEAAEPKAKKGAKKK